LTNIQQGKKIWLIKSRMDDENLDDWMIAFGMDDSLHEWDDWDELLRNG
jgi:hypothetical protein